MTLDEVIDQLRELPSFVATVPGIIEQLEAIRDQHARELEAMLGLQLAAKDACGKWRQLNGLHDRSKVMRRLEETLVQVRQVMED